MKPPSSDCAIDWRGRGEERGEAGRRGGGGNMMRGVVKRGELAVLDHINEGCISPAVTFTSFENLLQGVYIFSNSNYIFYVGEII